MTKQLTRMPWWASPAGINIGFLLPLLLLISAADQSSFEALTIRGARFLTAPYIVLGASLLLLQGFGGWVAAQIKTPDRKRRVEEPAYEVAILVIGAIALAAYVYFFRDLLSHPKLLLGMIKGTYRPDRTNIALSVGITSIVNVAPAFFSAYGYAKFVLRKRLGLTAHLMLLALLGFTVLRTYAWSERVALIEAVVPLALAMAWNMRNTKSLVPQWMIRLGPYAALPLLVVYFGIAESVRSWSSSTYHQKTGFWQFVIGRLTSYYYTSLNNGAGVLATTHWPTYKFELTLNWLHKAPVIGHAFSAMVNLRYFIIQRFLTSYGDEEFNNPSGLFGVVYDLGIPLGAMYFVIVGFVSGLMLRAYQREQPVGVYLYPVFFLSFLEVFRYPYLGASRAFTWLLGIVLCAAIGKFFSRVRIDNATDGHDARLALPQG